MVFMWADYRADPRTAGFLPPGTAEQAAAFLGEVEHWSARARRLLAGPFHSTSKVDYCDPENGD